MLASEEGCERKGLERNYGPTIYRSLGRWCGLGPRCRIGVGGPLQQQDRAIRKGGAAVRRKPWRGTDGAAIDWRSARSPTDARLGQAGRREGASIVQCGHGTRQAARCPRQSLGLHAGARRGQAYVQSAVTDSEGQSRVSTGGRPSCCTGCCCRDLLRSALRRRRCRARELNASQRRRRPAPSGTPTHSAVVFAPITAGPGGGPACPPCQPSDPLSPARLGAAPAKGGRRAQRRARRRGRDQSAGGYPLHGLPLSGAGGSVSRARDCAQGRRTKGAHLSQAGGRAASVVRGAPEADAAMPAKTRIVVDVAAAPVAILAGGMSWQWLAGRTTLWARFLGTEAPPDRICRQRLCAQAIPCAECHSTGGRACTGPSMWPNSFARHAAFSATSKSSTRSSGCSRPHESRTSPSLMPSSARAAGVRRWCVVVAGWVIRLLASPRLLLMRTSLSVSWKRNAAALPPLTSKATSVEPARICRSATAACGWSLRPG